MDPSLLPAISAFCQVARAGSFTRAAGTMGVSPSALSQTIRALEAKLDTRLLHRTTRSVSLTEAGRDLLDHVGPGLQLVEQAVQAVDEVRGIPAGEIRVNTSRLASRHFIEPHLSEFAQRYPRVRLELVADDGLCDIVGEGFDAGIRLGESLSPNMIAIPITPTIRMSVVGSPDYFSHYPKPKTPADLVQHNCVRFRLTTGRGILGWKFTDPGRRPRDFEVEPHGSFTTNDDESMLRAALRGIGLVQHQNLVTRPYIAKGELVEVLASWCTPFAGFHLYVPTRTQLPAKMRAFIDFLVEKRERTTKS